ncbi:MAG: tRNA (N6-isopentenyl adenosine(37)-C2)-methylthiotransferase MiaB [Chloracidobacterium sp.]|nr:tRNA (N6-isopentenyl adenosine(37)-C2)-methylthiotransferase MiaB [Chloracidobacterium sp.]
MWKKVYLETYGCQMNVHDSEKASHALLDLGYSQTSVMSEADLVLLNTCMVREKAARKVFARINAIKREIKKCGSKPDKESPVFGVMGCVAQAEAERLFERSQDIKMVMGTQAISRLPALIGQLEKGFPRVIDVRLSKEAEFLELEASDRQTKHIAYITITEGCNKFCSFCIVPFTRGRERSRPADKIIAEARALGEQGYKEVQLLGQNVNSYGLSGRYHGTPAPEQDDGIEISFARLLDRVAAESGVPRIKYTTSYPRDFDEEIVRVMDARENLCEWVHLPAQAGSDRMLRAMRRGYTRREYMEKICAIKRAKREISITGDLIVGFPGETEDDFNETISLVAEVEYDGLYIFKYSPRPMTPAAAYTDSIPEELKTERFLRLQELQDRIQRRRYERYLGRTVEVLPEGMSSRSSSDYTGHTRCNKVVNFPVAPVAPVATPKESEYLGKLVNVRITGVKSHSLYGEMVGSCA